MNQPYDKVEPRLRLQWYLQAVSGSPQPVRVRLVAKPGLDLDIAARRVDLPVDVDPDTGRGIATHAAGHLRLTRYAQNPDIILFPQVLLSLETARVSAWMAERFPGAKPWLVQSLRRTAGPSREPRVVVDAMRVEPFLDFEPPLGLDQRTLRALRITREARRRYHACQPGPGPVEPLGGARLAEYRSLVARFGVLAVGRETPEEQNIRWNSLLAFRIYIDEIIPNLRSLDGSSWRSPRPQAKPPPAASPEGGGEGEEPNFDDRVKKHGHLARDLERALRRLEPARRGRRIAAPIGDQPRLEESILAKHNPGSWSRLMSRRPRRAQPDPGFLLLVDLSGSMAGGEIDAVLDALSIVLPALDRVRIPRAVYGFQDQLIPILGRRDALDGAKLDAMALETRGSRPGGHNVPDHNDDGPCLLEAARRWVQASFRDPWILVLSDGRPNGKRSTEADLHGAVRACRRMGISLAGIGIGPGTRHVEDFYQPMASGEVALDDLARVLGEYLARGARG